jgi:hypothetical protein
VESERGLPSPDVSWVSASRLSVGKTAAVRSRTGLHVLQHREGLKENFSFLPFLTIQKLELWQPFNPVFFRTVFRNVSINVLVLLIATLRKTQTITVYIYIYIYLQSINFLQFTLAGKTGMKNLCCATPDLVLSHS